MHPACQGNLPSGILFSQFPAIMTFEQVWSPYMNCQL
jgi:hypothetical protein